jgi:hypothetical protein
MNKETLEEAVELYVWGGIYLNEPEKQQTEIAFYEGAKWQAEKNKKDIESLIKIIKWYDDNSDVRPSYHTETIGEITMWDWFEQFKKK